MADPNLESLQAMVQRLLDFRKDDLVFQKDTKQRLASIESMLVTQRRVIAVDAESAALVSARVDRLAEEVDRIKRRLDLTE